MLSLHLVLVTLNTPPPTPTHTHTHSVLLQLVLQLNNVNQVVGNPNEQGQDTRIWHPGVTCRLGKPKAGYDRVKEKRREEKRREERSRAPNCFYAIRDYSNSNFTTSLRFNSLLFYCFLFLSCQFFPQKLSLKSSLGGEVELQFVIVHLLSFNSSLCLLRSFNASIFCCGVGALRLSWNRITRA